MVAAHRFPWDHHGETLVVETPEQTAVELRVAPFGTRIVAALLDKLVILVPMIVLLLVAVVVLAKNSIEATPDLLLWIIAAFMVLQWLFSLFYFVWWEMRREGLTWGKRRMSIRTVLGTGRGMTLGPSLVRNLARVVDDIPLLWLVPTLSKGNRRLGDWLAGTFVVVEQRPATKRRGTWIEKLAPSYRELVDKRFHFTAQMAAKLYADDLNLLEYFETRIQHARPLVRREMIAKLAAKYVERLELGAEIDRVLEDPTRFLQELGLFLRGRFDERPV